MIRYKVTTTIVEVETAETEVDRYNNVKTTGRDRKDTIIDTTVTLDSIDKARAVHDVTNFIESLRTGGAK